ncbi:MAG: HD domain-containing protein [Firmicutes bacterium]|nr:HD domain-containing protein [Bacillota bacterium]MCL5058696.1 HD domain-containing protein [Actinomycetota bacterium]
MNITSFDLKNILSSLSTALDFTYSGLSSHHKRVALMSLKLARKLGLPHERLKNLYIAALIHDIGAISMREKEILGELEILDPYAHSEMGYRMVKEIKFLEPVSYIVRSHHDAWKGGNPSGLSKDGIPLESRLINAVDRLDVLIDHRIDLLDQPPKILRRLNSIAGTIIDPGIFVELADLANAEGFWLDLEYEFLSDLLCSQTEDFDMTVENDMLVDISLLFAGVIDKKSVFTHRHSRLVAASAFKMAGISGFSTEDTKKMVVAGLLHDLGKLVVPEEILEKPAKLSPEELRLIKRHTYFTHRILDKITGFEEINRWASFHHERMDGTGYPFRLTGESIPIPSRYMAVADVFSALAEDRPYRRGLPGDKITGILDGMSGSALDPRAVEMLKDNYRSFEELLAKEDPLSQVLA